MEKHKRIKWESPIFLVPKDDSDIIASHSSFYKHFLSQEKRLFHACYIVICFIMSPVLFLFSMFNNSLGKVTQSYSFKYNLFADASQTVSSHSISLKSIFIHPHLYNISLSFLIGISSHTCPKLSTDVCHLLQTASCSFLHLTNT